MQRRKGQKYGCPFSFLVLDGGKGFVWKGDMEGCQIDDEFGVSKADSTEGEFIELEDSRKLGISALGFLKQHPRISAIRKFIESWYLILGVEKIFPQPPPLFFSNFYLMSL